MEHICNTCFAPATTYCSGCKFVYYCSRQCQAADWKEHATYCRTFRGSLAAQIRDHYHSLRIISLASSDRAVEGASRPPREEDKFNSILSHLCFWDKENNAAFNASDAADSRIRSFVCQRNLKYIEALLGRLGLLEQAQRILAMPKSPETTKKLAQFGFTPESLDTAMGIALKLYRNAQVEQPDISIYPGNYLHMQERFHEFTKEFLAEMGTHKPKIATYLKYMRDTFPLGLGAALDDIFGPDKQ